VKFYREVTTGCESERNGGPGSTPLSLKGEPAMDTARPTHKNPGTRFAHEGG